ncbi:hypothetical protein MSAN_02421900 [Mycena sanguinolenta]|uniref:DUF6534 domain-containing protein n=1 Tax=Mycena sanguinolenta TaxID=230812 RepID=A0A8H6X3B3_9AGAR|nr:hypothetical protein MSAN_02421900 [Mycena sanguinolenta]
MRGLSSAFRKSAGNLERRISLALPDRALHSHHLKPPSHRYGPMLIGVFLNMILYGVMLGQVLNYFQTYRTDPLWMRLFVWYLSIVGTANTALDMHMMYQPLIQEYGESYFRLFSASSDCGSIGQKPVFFPTVFLAEPLFVVLLSMPIQLFFAWRIHQLTKSIWIPSLITLLGLASFGGGVWTTIRIHVLKLFAKKASLAHARLGVVPDILRSRRLDYCLAGLDIGACATNKKTGFRATDSVVDKIIRTTIQTGMITAVFSILDVHYAINFVFDLCLTKLYINCLMSTLNARQKLLATSHPSTFQQLNLPTSRGPMSAKRDIYGQSWPPW